MRLPKDFMIGAATAAHQVEGNNTNCDFWVQEHLPHTSFLEPSGEACDHYHRYETDIRLLSEAGCSAYRFSVEWARIEPEEGCFDETEIAHYRDVIRCCRRYGIEPVLTLHHFTSPIWLIRKGGWAAETVTEDFCRYASFVIQRLGSELRWVCTLNEANLGLQLNAISRRYQLMAEQSRESSAQVGMNLGKMRENAAFLARENLDAFGTEDPQVFVRPHRPEVDLRIARTHQAARAAIKAICPELKVGLTLSLHDLQAEPGGEAFADAAWEEEFRHYLPYIREDDFLGVQNYTRTRYGASGQMPPPEGAELTQMNYEFYPEALEHVLRRVHREFKGDLLVTENGVAVSDDSRRVEFLRRAFEGVRRCLDDGLPIKGYLYWSLLDNFEWQRGYSMTFGLVAVDRSTQARTAKPSLYALGRLAADNKAPVEQSRKYEEKYGK